MKEKVSKKFNELYGEGAILFASPGRINLIGEHTDYNGGFVFPGAVDKGIVAAIRLNGTDKVRAYALDLGESSEFGLNEADKPAESWACYIFGVCREIQKRGGKGVSGMKQRDEDFVENMFISSSHENILFITNQGNMYRPTPLR